MSLGKGADQIPDEPALAQALEDAASAMRAMEVQGIFLCGMADRRLLKVVAWRTEFCLRGSITACKGGMAVS